MEKSSANNPRIIAHRGASALAPENTLAAFALALESGADGVELDVRLARDGIPVVIHDATLRRTGLRDGVVAELTSRELGQANVGEWFNRAHPQMAREKYRRELLPTLEQVFDLFKNANRTNNSVIYVEMKADKVRETNVDLSASLVQLINDYCFQSRVIVVSFSLKALTQIEQIDPSIRTGALFEPKRSAAGILSGRRLIASALDCGADEILLHHLMATRRLVGLAADRNLTPVVWTVDDPKWMNRAVRFGIQALITNNPAAMG